MTEHKQIGSVLRTYSSHNGQISAAAARCLPDIGRNLPGIRPLFSLQPAVRGLLRFSAHPASVSA